MNELGLRFRVLADDLPLFGQVNFNVEVFEGHAIAEVSIEPVRFLDQDNAARFVVTEKAHHLAELLSARRLGRLRAHEPRAGR
ncbi:MAG TPA: hypothetical protein VMB47_16675 [Candidatus Aquilonibacter sp.]|nr:hypothetical protein [Candidatus Aquilonibacter sp.]